MEQSKQVLLRLPDVAALLGALTLDQLYHRLKKIDRRTAEIEITGHIIPLEKIGKQWVCRRADIEPLLQPTPETYTPAKEPAYKPAAKTKHKQYRDYMGE